MSLAEYRKKRDFGRTAEPKGRAPKPAPSSRFVVHRHHATRLHWDVRLELRGVLASWAVPQGPPLEAGKRRLAVHTEDHPIEYLTFHGVIPDGYGAGRMTIWDTGTYELLAEKDGEYKLRVHGTRLEGEWVLVRTRQNEGRDWLMIKHGTPPKDHPLAANVSPMLAVSAEEPFDSPEFGYEPKWDGVRTIAFVDGGEVRLQTRNLLDCTAQYPEAHEIAEALTGAYQAIVDGEVVALDERGAPSFQRLQPRMHLRDEATIRKLRRSTPVLYQVFDLLWADGEDLRPLPLRERLRRLEAALTPMGAIRRSESFPGTGRVLFDAARAHGFEGIVAKRLDAPYVAGRSAAWVKIKAQRTMDCVVGGWTAGQGGRADTLGALLLGVYRDGKLEPVGHVGTGFDERTLRALLDELRRRESPTSPFARAPRANQPARWCLPELVCEVRFSEWTADGGIRHPVFIGLRSDKRPEECRRESPVALADDGADPVGESGGGAWPGAAEAEPSGHGGAAVAARQDGQVKLTNLKKIFWPAERYTKGDLIEYYETVAPLLLPYLRDRPLVLTRYPDGITGKSFFQKDAPEFVPKWVRTERIYSKDADREIDYFIVNDVETLRYVANLGTIPLHLWGSRLGSLERPDWLVLDLDPKGAPFADVVTVARELHRLLEDLELPSHVKTSGATGLHILVPLGARYTYEEARTFARLLALLGVEAAPGISTIARPLRARGGKVYIDFGQNGHGRTIVAPYSLRALPDAPASCPLLWSEMTARLDPARFTLKTLPGRFEKMTDPLAPVLTGSVDIATAVERIEQRLASTDAAGRGAAGRKPGRLRPPRA